MILPIPDRTRKFTHYVGGKQWSKQGTVRTYIDNEVVNITNDDETLLETFEIPVATLELNNGDEIVLTITADRDQWGKWWTIQVGNEIIMFGQEDGTPSMMKALIAGMQELLGWEHTPERGTNE